MTKRLRHVIVAALLGSAVYFASTALDREIGELASVVAGALSHRVVEPEQELLALRAQRIGERMVLAVVLSFFIAGLPAAVIAIVIDKTRRRPGRRRLSGSQSFYQGCFVFQLVSIFLSTLWSGPAVVFGGELIGREQYMAMYFGLQVLVGLWALPSWRRLLHQAGEARMRDYFFREAA